MACARSVFAFVLLSLASVAGAQGVERPPILALVERLLPGHAGDFAVESLQRQAGANAFEVEARNGRIVLRGDDTISQAVALNWYLRHVARVSVSWYKDDPVDAPAVLPLPKALVRRSTRLRDRFFLNYCTFGYSLPYWNWDQWERLIDWMALNGIDQPLAQNGNEYVWQQVWRRYGLTDEEIRSYFTGPAHLPWHRMVNIDRWEGPLSQGFIDQQRDLQKRILTRERELGQRPVLCAFAGHVPEALKAHRPDLKVSRIPPGWSGFKPEYGCWFLDPLDPAFRAIQASFLREQEKAYGTDHLYGTDPFNEIEPPDWDPAYLASVSRAIYEGMAQADPQAVWLQMGWAFFSDPLHWTPPRMKAMIQAVPQGRMEVIDYVCETHEMYRETSGFHGAPFLWSYLGNFGGNNQITGPLGKIDRLLGQAMAAPDLKNLAGVGGTLEGLNNPVVYEYLFDRIWEGGATAPADWVQEAARARAGGEDPAVEAAWDLLCRKILVDRNRCRGWQGSVLQMRNPALRNGPDDPPGLTVAYANGDLKQVWDRLLQAGPAARRRSAIRQDLAEATRQCLGNLASTLRDRMAGAYERRDPAAFRTAARAFLALGRDLDGFLVTRGEYLLGKWVAEAEACAPAPSERPAFARNARTILTIWGGEGNLIDYASRMWNGLLRDYCLPRWEAFIQAAQADLDGGPKVDRASLMRGWRAQEVKFAADGGTAWPVQPEGDVFRLSQALYEKYEPLFPKE